MSAERDIHKAITGKTWKDWTTTYRVPTVDESIDELFKGARSNFPLRLLGTSEEKITITEEERTHFFLMGSTGEGKSKYIEHLIRQDIFLLRNYPKLASGVCLLDPSAHGQTALDVLRYCLKIGYKKVCLINPHHLRKFKVVPGINPFHPAYRKASIDNIMDTLNVLFNVKEEADTSRIRRYMRAVLHVLHNAHLTLHESKYFTNRIYEQQRKDILSYTEPLSPHRLALEEAFKSGYLYTTNFQSTVGRLGEIIEQDSSLGLMFACDRAHLEPKGKVYTSIPFDRMVADGWVILVNLTPALGFSQMDSKLLASMIINELIFAIDRIRERSGNRWDKRFYLYIDEAGDYANRKLAEMLIKRRKSGLKVTFGFQYFDQFQDLYVRSAIKQLSHIKAMFNQPDPDDRMVMSKMFYGGDIPPSQANYVNSDIPKQHAVLKAGKRKPQRVLTPYVGKVNLSLEDEEKGIKKLYRQTWYHHPKDIEEVIRKRFNDDETPRNTKPSGKGAKTNRRPTVPTVFD